MSISAARLGKAPLTIDWSGMGGLGNPSFSGASTLVTDAAFFQAPLDPQISGLQAVLELGEFPGVTSVLWLGIGGSSLGPKLLVQALSHLAPRPGSTTPEFHFVENPDPVHWAATMKKLRPESTLVVAVTKSGVTFETMACLALALDWMPRDLWTKNVIAVTDPDKGDLLTLARSQKIRTLPIHPKVGGRYSIVTPVGLLALKLLGLSPEKFLLGAQFVHDAHLKTAPAKNPIGILASAFASREKTHPVHLLMAYPTPLHTLGDFWAQAWGESLGKAGRGFTPLASRGTLDQHSLMQLLIDGPDDKVVGFVTCDAPPAPVSIPRITPSGALAPPIFSALAGKTLSELQNTEQQAVARVLTRKSRLNFTIRLDRIDEESVGALVFSLLVLTAETGAAMGVNPYDQPGVESVKQTIAELLGASSSNSLRLESDASNAVERLRGRQD